MRVVRAAWMGEADRRTIEALRIPSLELMENAARACLRAVDVLVPPHRRRQVLVVAGRGNNGGDGIALARLLALRKDHVRIALLADPGELKPDCATQLAGAERVEVPWQQVQAPEEFQSMLEAMPGEESLIVDALFGTGLDRPVRDGFSAEAIRLINRSGLAVLSIDLPSGLSESFFPAEGEVVCARWTVALGAPKVAHLYPDGNSCCGETVLVDIGIPADCIGAAMEFPLELAKAGDFSFLTRPRRCDAHKGDFGHVLCVAGSVDRPGAAIMAALSTLRAGAGRCTLALPPGVGTAVAIANPELMTVVRPSTGLFDNAYLAPYSVVLAGPGLGLNEEARQQVLSLPGQVGGPLILDADALTLVAREPEKVFRKGDHPLILTPHVGEFSRLFGCSAETIRRDRIGRARHFALETGAHVILKGHHTLIASPDGRVTINPTGNPGMATAGAGDVLAGVVAGLLAESDRGHDLHEVLAAAVFVHGLAGDLAARKLGERSLLAGDLLSFLPAALKNPDAARLLFPLC